ncbi:Acyl-CoA-binding domain-containing protein [Zostera marina]|uniref:Acyl-CoA-binding domain-containing protein n=1 Tax=Zostera marina TaxID=29655 RepID=A0A0K9PGI7_ZOSMR|nr:Acyl-CoA-binding domain-containing protein [Zostera marina]
MSNIGGDDGTEIENGKQELGIRSMLSNEVPYDEWTLLHVSGQRPSARYKHAAEVINEKLYVIGGSRYGRYISDIQVLNLVSSTWSGIKLNQNPNNDESNGRLQDMLPAIAGHSLIKWKDVLLVVAGNPKDSIDTVSVWTIDPTTDNCVAVKTSGKIPIARGGQSVTLVGSKLIMFGGEDNRRKVLNDIHILDLETMSWDAIETSKNTPGPRFDHTASSYEDRYLLIFGGSSHSACFSDLHILDLYTMDWSKAQVEGHVINPRAGHACIVVDGIMYIVGGGDNKSGAFETIKLNMSKLIWSVTTKVSQRHPLASEGLSLCLAEIDGVNFFIAFGGYNGKYHNEVFVLKPKPSGPLAPPRRILQSSAAAAAAASVTVAYALASVENEKVSSTQVTDKNANEIKSEKSSHNNIEFTMEKKLDQSILDDIRNANHRLVDELKELCNSHGELSMELESVQAQLESERSRCSKLELQVEDIKKKLESQHLIEAELEILRHGNSSSHDHPDAKMQKSGVWNWMSGAV